MSEQSPPLSRQPSKSSRTSPPIATNLPSSGSGLLDLLRSAGSSNAWMLRGLAAAFEWMTVDDAEASAGAAVGGLPIFVPRGYGGSLRLSDGAAKVLGDLLSEGLGTGMDFKDDVDIELEPSFPVASGEPLVAMATRLEPVIGSRRWTVKINAAVWNDPRCFPSTAHQLAILARQLTFAMQENDRPWYRTGFTWRYLAEQQEDFNRRNVVPKPLQDMPFRGLDPRDEKYSLSQIAWRAAGAVLDRLGVKDDTFLTGAASERK